MSVGQLLAMGRFQAAMVIKTLPKGVRRKLAHLATIGAMKKAAELAEYQNLIFDLTQEHTA